MKIATTLSSLMLLAVPVAIAEEAASASASEECQTIYDLVCGNNDLKQFCALIDETGLVDMYTDRRLTVFAPTNKAVNRMNFKSLDEEQLQEVVEFHAHRGVLQTSEMPCYAGYNTITMMDGKDSRTICVDYIPTFQKGGGNTDENKPAIISTDIEACNGVVHMLDAMLLPNHFDESVLMTGKPPKRDEDLTPSGAQLNRSGWFMFAAIFLFMNL